MEKQTITVTIVTSGEKCELSDSEIREWYEKNISQLFNPEYGTPQISVNLKREEI